MPLHQSINATMALSHIFPASGVDWLFGAIFAIRNSSTDLFCPKMCWNVSIRVMSLVRLFLNTVFLYPSTRFIYIFDRSDLGNIVTSMLCIASQIIKRVLCEMCLWRDPIETSRMLCITQSMWSVWGYTALNHWSYVRLLRHRHYSKSWAWQTNTWPCWSNYGQWLPT